MSHEHQRQTEFLRQCLRYHETPASRMLGETIDGIQRDQRTLQRALWLVVTLGTLGIVGTAYAALLMNNRPNGTPASIARFVTNGSIGVGLGALICLLFFLALSLIYRQELDRRREECRKFVTSLLESRLGGRLPRQDQAGSERIESQSGDWWEAK